MERSGCLPGQSPGGPATRGELGDRSACLPAQECFSLENERVLAQPWGTWTGQTLREVLETSAGEGAHQSGIKFNIPKKY